MYVFQFMDASWRIARMTNTKFPLPVTGPAREMFDMPYRTEASARAAMTQITRLAAGNPEMFAK